MLGAKAKKVKGLLSWGDEVAIAASWKLRRRQMKFDNGMAEGEGTAGERLLGFFFGDRLE